MPSVVLIRGGGELASGVALRLFRAGLRVVITELPQPLAIRRLVSFAEAVYRGETQVEEITACLVKDPVQAMEQAENQRIPVLIDPEATIIKFLKPLVLVDARMTKRAPEYGMEVAPLVIGLGPGFIGGVNCHAVIETHRGHYLGRVIWQGEPLPDTGIPEGVQGHYAERVLRAPCNGLFRPLVEIGESLEQGRLIAEVNGCAIRAPFAGVLRGILHAGLQVQAGLKIGDLDPRNDPRYCTLVSDKSLAVGGGVLEAILSRSDIRARLWEN